MTDLTWDFEMYIASAWTSVKADTVIGVVPLEWNAGASAADPVGVRVASTGILNCALNNSATNSGTLLGYYSPDHANCRAGFAIGTKVRTSLTDGGVTRYREYRIVDISPTFGQYGERLSYITAVDYMDELAQRRLSLIAVQTDKRTDQLYQTVIDNLPAGPQGTLLATGLSNLKYALHDVQDERTTAMSAIQRIAQSDLEYVFLTGGTTNGEVFTSETRYTRRLRSSSGTLSDTMMGLDVVHSKENIYNIINVTAYPVEIDTSATTTLARLQNEVKLAANATTTTTMRYRDPNGAAQRVSGLAMVTPVASTHYDATYVSGSDGTDATADVSVAVTFGGNSAEVAYTNGGTVSYVWKTNLIGKGVYLYDPVICTAQGTASIAAYGPRELNLAMPYQDRTSVAQDFADYLLSLYKDPHSNISNLVMCANRSAALMTLACSLDIGSKITLAETATGVNADYVINSVSYRIEGAGLLFFTAGALEKDQGSMSAYMILDTGKLDTNKLAY